MAADGSLEHVADISGVAEGRSALDLREQAARAAEARLTTQMQTRPPADSRANARPDPQEDQFDSLARIYQAMKPAKAAKVFEQLDLEVQLGVAKRMRDRSTAMLLAAMTPEGAARLSMALAGRERPRALARPISPGRATAAAVTTPIRGERQR